MVCSASASWNTAAKPSRLAAVAMTLASARCTARQSARAKHQSDEHSAIAAPRRRPMRLLKRRGQSRQRQPHDPRGTDSATPRLRNHVQQAGEVDHHLVVATTCAPRLAISSATEVKAVTSTNTTVQSGAPSFSSARCGGHCGQLQPTTAHSGDNWRASASSRPGKSG